MCWPLKPSDEMRSMCVRSRSSRSIAAVADGVAHALPVFVIVDEAVEEPANREAGVVARLQSSAPLTPQRRRATWYHRGLSSFSVSVGV